MDFISTQQSIPVAAPAQRAFAAACGFDVPAIMRKRWPLPGVLSVEGHSRPWSSVGEQRLLRMTDRTVICEELRELVPETYYAYRVYGFSRPLSDVVDEGFGSFLTVDVGEDTSNLIWTYGLKPLAPFSRPTVGFLVRRLMPGYMRKALERLKRTIETQ